MVEAIAAHDHFRKTSVTAPRIITHAIADAQASVDSLASETARDWYVRRPTDAESWRKRCDSVRSEFPSNWLEKLYPAIAPSGHARERLDSVAAGRGVVVTTGQQPGLFGGPVYTLSKALSALAFADELQNATGVPVAPIFWAATDDTDFREASATAISRTGGAQLLRIDHPQPLGLPMSAMPLGDVSVQLEALAAAAADAIDTGPLDLLARWYRAGETVGSAYVSFLRELLAPLGIAVVDASHSATRAAAKPFLVKALERAPEIAANLKERNTEIESAGLGPQVQDVPGLSLVFSELGGARKRIPIKGAAKRSDRDDLGPNVLLRPVVERAILPTATYIGGPAEISYFAQVAPIADAIGTSRPAVVPRWSCTVIEPHVDRILKQLGLSPEDLRDPHAAEARIARARLSPGLLKQLGAMRAAVEREADALSAAMAKEGAIVSASVTGGLRANLARRIDRFERRLIAAAKRQHAEIMTEIATARGSLYPFGKPQERSLNFVPLLARYGPLMADDMLKAARQHATHLVSGGEEGAATLAESSTRQESV
jgi:bacillithiol synthase